jgi:hypothetical protein
MLNRFVDELEPRCLLSSAVITDDRQAIRADQAAIRFNFVQFRTTARLDRIAAATATAPDLMRIQNDLKQLRADLRAGSSNAIADLIALQTAQAALATDLRNAALIARQHRDDFKGKLITDRATLRSDIKQLLLDLQAEPHA